VKPSYTALKSLVAELDNFAYDKNLSNKTGFASVEAYRFLSGARTKIAAWSSHINTAIYNPYKPDCSWPRVAGVASFTANSVRVVNYLGKVKLVADNSKKDQNPTAGVIGIKVAGNPVIVELNP
jgi:hypothetical protein